VAKHTAGAVINTSYFVKCHIVRSANHEVSDYTTSLQTYLRKQFGEENVGRMERLFTRIDGPDEFQKEYSDYIPVIILRDPVERAWSDFWYQQTHNEGIPKGLEEAIKEKRYDPMSGERNIIRTSYYGKWLKGWRKYNPIVYWLRDAQRWEGFPKLMVNEKKPEITLKQEAIITEAIRCV